MIDLPIGPTLSSGMSHEEEKFRAPCAKGSPIVASTTLKIDSSYQFF
jgi:hypothetical protein